MRFGVIGLGTHGRRYARHLAAGDVEGARLVSVCRRDRAEGELVARQLGVEFAGDYRQVLSDPSVDAVAITVPCSLHPTLVSEALAAGKAVLVEKPLAPDAKGALTILEAARSASRPAMVAQTLRFNTVVRVLADRLDSLGKLRAVSLSQRFEPSDRGWLDEMGGGGILRNTGIHSFDLLRHLTGLEVEQVSCITQRVVTQKTEDVFAAVLRLTDGVTATVENNRSTASRTGRIELVGEAGQLIGDHVHHQLAEIRGLDHRPLEMPEPVPTIRECLAAFVSACREETPVPIPIEEGFRAVEIVDACRASARDGGPVDLNRHPL